MPVVLGYSPPPEYLQKVGGPSESEPMSETLRALVPGVATIPWRGAGEGPANTQVEVHNVMQLALGERFTRVRFLTVLPHLPRVLLLAANEKSRVPYEGIASELVLLEHDRGQSERVLRLLGSPAFGRTAQLELQGIRDRGLQDGTSRA